MNPFQRLAALAALLLACAAGTVDAQILGSGDAQMLPANAGLFRYVFDIPKQYINDHCLIYAKDQWHLYFIQGTVSGSWGHSASEVSIGHATSPNLLDWTLQDTALKLGATGALDAGHVYAPSVIENYGKYYMIYTGSEKTFNDGEHLMMATSTDLFHWERSSPEPIFAPDTSWAMYIPAGNGGKGGPASGRDPHIYRDFYEDRGFICYYVARLKADSSRPSADGEYSCIAAATSFDLVHWKDRGPVLTRRTRGEDSYTWGHPESPCVVRYDDRYYLFWKSGSGIRYVISDNPLDFHDRNEYMLSTAHASEIVEHDDKWYITSCSRDVDDVTHSSSDRTRGLFLAGLEWKGRHPVVVALPEGMP